MRYYILVVNIVSEDRVHWVHEGLLTITADLDKALIIDSESENFAEYMEKFSDRNMYRLVLKTYADLCSYRCVNPADIVKDGFPGAEL